MDTEEQTPLQHNNIGSIEPDELQQAVEASTRSAGLLAEFRREASHTA
jgi:hypothetical protein